MVLPQDRILPFLRWRPAAANIDIGPQTLGSLLHWAERRSISSWPPTSR